MMTKTLQMADFTSQNKKFKYSSLSTKSNIIYSCYDLK